MSWYGIMGQRIRRDKIAVSPQVRYRAGATPAPQNFEGLSLKWSNKGDLPQHILLVNWRPRRI